MTASVHDFGCTGKVRRMMNRKTLVLDPGHGGTSAAGGSTPNRGISTTGLFEKDVALDIATRVRQRLSSDFTVVLTREDDRNVTLAERAAAARRVQADMFVSIHFSGTPERASGSSDVVVARQSLPASRQLAQSLLRHVGGVTGQPGSMLEADLGQIAAQRHAPATAACLVEVASLDDPAEADRLDDPRYLDKIADAFARSVRESATSDASATSHVQGAGARRHGAPLARATAVLVPDIDYSATSLLDATSTWLNWFARYGSWYAGVPNEALPYFPHGAICQLELYDVAGNGPAYGTGFYIADEVLLTVGHNFYLPSRGWQAGSVVVQPGYSPNQSIFPTERFSVNAQSIVHPNWWSRQDGGFDLAVLAVPGLPAQTGAFSVANMSMQPSTQVVVSGYGKSDDAPSASQPQRMDGATITRVDPEIAYYPIQTLPGHSGSPLFYESMVIGVHRAGFSEYENQATLLTPDKNDWIIAQAGGGVAAGLSAARPARSRALTVTANSTQREQSDEVRVRVARSIARWESGGRYDAVHDDSARINFGLGSWTGTRIADVLDSYASFAAGHGLTAQMHAHFDGEAGFTTIRDRFRTNGIATTMTTAERAQLAALGADTALQRAQDEHLANDLIVDLDAIGNDGPPWYPYIDGGMGAISELAAHVLVAARHQSGTLGGVLAAVIAHFGGDATLGQGMVAGTITERDVLDQVAETVIARVAAQYRTGVRNRYNWLFATFSGSDLAYYFDPA